MKVYSIFNSINGEVNHLGQGSFATFIRLAGCNFIKNPCPYCDTKYALNSDAGFEMTLIEIIKKIVEIGCHNLTITGGEPMFQEKELHELIFALHLKSNMLFNINIETNGSYLIRPDWDVRWVTDCHLHNKKEFKMENLKLLGSGDFLKFVITNEEDYRFARAFLEFTRTDHKSPFTIAFSPAMTGNCPPKNRKISLDLLEWMKRDNLFHIMYNTQIHKQLNLKEDK